MASYVKFPGGSNHEAVIETEFFPKEIREKYGLGEFHDEQECKKSAFIENVSDEVILTISEEDQQYMIEHPDPIEYHFGLGMYIRNKYIHGKKLDFFYGMADSLSNEIIKTIIEKIANKRKAEYIDQVSEQVSTALSSEEKLLLCNNPESVEEQIKLYHLVRDSYIGDQTFDFFYGVHGLEKGLAEEIVKEIMKKLLEEKTD